MVKAVQHHGAWLQIWKGSGFREHISPAAVFLRAAQMSAEFNTNDVYMLEASLHLDKRGPSPGRLMVSCLTCWTQIYKHIPMSAERKYWSRGACYNVISACKLQPESRMVWYADGPHVDMRYQFHWPPSDSGIYIE